MNLKIRIYALGAVLLLTTAALAKTSPPMQVDDYLADADHYQGKHITLVGSPMCVTAKICMLYKSDLKSNAAVSFDPSRLSLDDKKYLLSCDPYTNPCLVRIDGMAGDGSLDGPFQVFAMTSVVVSHHHRHVERRLGRHQGRHLEKRLASRTR
jgi:hypothetical protein